RAINSPWTARTGYPAIVPVEHPDGDLAFVKNHIFGEGVRLSREATICLPQEPVFALDEPSRDVVDLRTSFENIPISTDIAATGKGFAVFVQLAVLLDELASVHLIAKHAFGGIHVGL